MPTDRGANRGRLKLVRILRMKRRREKYKYVPRKIATPFCYFFRCGGKIDSLCIPLVQFASRGAIQRPRRNILILIPQNPPAAASFPFATTARREERKAMPIWPASKFPPPSRPIHDMASIHGACVWNCRSADGWCGLGSFASHRITPKKCSFYASVSAS